MGTTKNEIQLTSLKQNQNFEENQTTGNFEGFIYDLFEKNGILNDLRAHLRGHIVTVLKTARTGEIPACQKQFTQRLELPNQALNMLIAEYLVRLEFSYTLSVFVSEIPLANMLFGFAQSLLQYSPDEALTDIFFSEEDVCSLLNHLGLRMDSDHAINILQMYKTEQKPLLVCIFKCMPLCKDPYIEPDNYSDCSATSSQISDVARHKDKRNQRNCTSHHEKCKHYTFCKVCQNRILKLRERYKKKKKTMAEKEKQTAMIISNNNILKKNISEMERNLIDEMFQQLQTVFEQEIEMLKSEEQKRSRRSAENCMSQLEKKRDEMEAAFKEKEVELYRNIQHKKQFLWGLARSLHEQHEHLTRAMRAVKHEGKRLTDKEQILKTQLREAQETLKNRGEEMKTLISNEIEILAGHLKEIKKEKDSLNNEKKELETMKSACEMETKALKINNVENLESSSRFEVIQNELSALKEYLETTKSHVFVADTSTNTECKAVYLNNEQIIERNTVDDRTSNRVNPNQVINDLKKQKNINRSNAEDICRSRSRSKSPTRIEPATLTTDSHAYLLNEENERLKIFAKQQQEHINRLTSLQSRLQAELTTAQCMIDNLTNNNAQPLPEPFYVTMQRASACTPPYRLAGRGEEVLAYTTSSPRVLNPGDRDPFIGVVDAPHTTSRRHLVNQWRALRKVGSKPSKTAPSQPGCSTKDEAGGTKHEPTPGTSGLAQKDSRSKTHEEKTDTANSNEKVKKENGPTSKQEQKLKQKSQNKLEIKSTTHRDKSPEVIVKEAKRQLRKLEIEADAIQQSYLRFKKNQSERKVGTPTIVDEALSSTSKPSIESTLKRRLSPQRSLEEPRKLELQSARIDYYNVMKEYQLNYEEHFKNRNTASYRVKPIPKAFAKTEEKREHKDNYLEKPLTEFRKLYHSRNSGSYTRSAYQIKNKENHINSEIVINEDKDIHRLNDIMLNEISDRQETEKQESKVLPEKIQFINNFLNHIVNENQAIVEEDLEKEKPVILNARQDENENQEMRVSRQDTKYMNKFLCPKYKEVPSIIEENSDLEKPNASQEEKEIENQEAKLLLEKKQFINNFLYINLKEDTAIMKEHSEKEKLVTLNPSKEEKDIEKHEVTVLGDDAKYMNKFLSPKLKEVPYIIAENSEIKKQVIPNKIQDKKETEKPDTTVSSDSTEFINNFLNPRSLSTNADHKSHKKAAIGQHDLTDLLKEKNDSYKAPSCEETPRNNLLVFVESSEDTQQISQSHMNGEKITTEMTVIITPKINVTMDEKIKSLEEQQSLEAEAKLKRNDVLENDSLPKVQADNKETDSNVTNEYDDDFSADIDNSSKNDLSKDISVLKTDDENEDFWDC